MPTSDWGDWLIREIESAEPEGVLLWYLGCNGIVVKGSAGTTLYIDPYVGLGDPPRTVRMIPVPFDPYDVTEVDAVLATHEHTDHVHGPTQAPILESTGATFFGPSESVATACEDERWSEEWDVSDEQFETLSVGDSVSIGEFRVTAAEANDPDAAEPVSYVIDHDAGTLFHGGDSKPAEAFERIGSEFDIDVGVLAFGTVGHIPDKETHQPVRTKWYNDENQLVEAATALRVDRLVPTHWDMWRGLTADPTVLHHHCSSFDYPRRLEVIQIGDHLAI